MRNLLFTGKLFGEQMTLKQVQKRTAKKLHEKGESVFIQSCNFHPFGVWSNAIQIGKEDNFNEFVNSFEYYNCSSVQGYYANFYININKQ